MKKYFEVLFVTLMFVVFLSSTASANLITNGGFESGNLSGWSCSGADTCIAESDTGFLSPYEGSYVMQGFDNVGYATLAQSFATTIGASYDFFFFSVAYQLGGNLLAYSFSGYSNAVSVNTTTNWLETSGTFLATASSTPLEFYFSTLGGTGTWLIDNVSVTPSNSVPEPATMLLLGLGLIGVAGIRRKLKK